MSADKSKGKKVVGKAEAEASKVKDDIAKGGKAVGSELKKGGSGLKADVKKLRKKL